MSEVELHTFGPRADGARNRQISTGRGVTVLVSPTTADDEEKAADMADALAAAVSDTCRSWTDLERRCQAAEELAERLKVEVRRLEWRVPPPSPVRTIGKGCVRFDGQGRLFMLNKRETGWASFGFMFDGWDDLFRRYAVRITEHGVDEHGPYWVAVPASPDPKDPTP